MGDKSNKYIVSIRNIENLPRITIREKDDYHNSSQHFKSYNRHQSNRGQNKSIINTNTCTVNISAKLKKESIANQKSKKDEVGSKNFNFDNNCMKSQLNDTSKNNQHQCSKQCCQQCQLPKEEFEQSYLNNQDNQLHNPKINNISSFRQNLYNLLHNLTMSNTQLRQSSRNRSKQHQYQINDQHNHRFKNQHHHSYFPQQSVPHNYYSNDDLTQTSALVSSSTSVPASLPLSSLAIPLPLKASTSTNSFISTSSYLSANVSLSSNLNSQFIPLTTNAGGNITNNNIIIQSYPTNQEPEIVLAKMPLANSIASKIIDDNNLNTNNHNITFNNDIKDLKNIDNKTLGYDKSESKYFHSEHKKHYEETDLDELIKVDIGDNISTLPTNSHHCDNISDQLSKIGMPKSSNGKKFVKTLSNLFSRNKSINSNNTSEESDRQPPTILDSNANSKNSSKRTKEFFSNSRKLFNFSQNNAIDKKSCQDNMKLIKNQSKLTELSSISEQKLKNLKQISGVDVGPRKNKNKYSLSLHNLQRLNLISEEMANNQQINLNSSEEILNDNNNNRSKIICNYESAKNKGKLSHVPRVHQFLNDYGHSNRQPELQSHSSHNVRIKKAISTCDNYELLPSSLVDSNSYHSGSIHQGDNNTSLRCIGSDGESECEMGSSNLSDECCAKSMGPNMVNSIDSDDIAEICQSNFVTNKKAKQSANSELENFYKNENISETLSKMQTASLSSLFVSRLKRTTSINKSNSFKSIVGDRNDNQIETRSINGKSTLKDNRQNSLRSSLIKPSKTRLNKVKNALTSTSNIPSGNNKTDLNNSMLRNAATQVLLRKNKNKTNKENVNECNLRCQSTNGKSGIDRPDSDCNNSVFIRNRAIDLISKRLSLPADIKFPASFLAKVQRELELIHNKNDNNCSTNLVLKSDIQQNEDNNFIMALLNTDLDKPISNEVCRKSLVTITLLFLILLIKF